DQSIQSKIKLLEKKFQKNFTFPALKTYQDRFQLHRKLGTGAMGSVYKARDMITGEWVALKTLPTKHQDDELLRAFLQEGRTAKRLKHPNIVDVFDYGIENEHYFISMEFLDGKTLKEVLAQVGAMNIRNFLSVALPLTRALAYAHDNHTIHRDIKPSNVMLLSNRTIKLMDFGISKITQFSDHKSIARGTPIYISPEQILGIQTTKQSDLYSLGVVFYEMISGKPPFLEGDILHDHIHKPAEEIGKVASEVPFRLVNIIMSCLAKKADRRPISAYKIIETLEIIQKEIDTKNL
ncbi:MAG: serine/threonine protein kinase, partial [Proteobacteria bacterium]|nr:serine/threonine protein kinase [Pseudomonadota bacterium]